MYIHSSFYFHLGGLSSPEKFISPKHQSVLEGDSFSIKCKSVFIPDWLHNEVRVPDEMIKKGRIIYVEKATLIDGGTYVCEGSTKDGLKFKAIATVEVIGEPSMPTRFLHKLQL